MVKRRLSLWLAGVCLLALGCESDHDAPEASPTTSVTHTSLGAQTPSSSARDLLLAKQFDMLTGGDGGVDIDCHTSLLRLIMQGHPLDRPLAWVSSSHDKVELRPQDSVALCLYRLPKSKPITVTVKAGDRTNTTKVKLVAQSDASEPSKDPLIDGRRVDVWDIGDSLLQSPTWTFFPSDPAFNAIALSGQLTLTASAGDVRTTYEVPLHWDQGAAALEGWERTRKMTLYGYPAGARVPVGLYRVTGFDHAVLERQVGQVTMPRARIAVFTIPQDVLRIVRTEHESGKDFYCLATPEVEGCVTYPPPAAS
ncbi:hypothetical protein GCM10023086_75450 [Streptomyces venetus]|uniref:Lipoprotein n=1 Tax=Streptomyces venetus TaxID=1701086 RepID=A0ABP8HJ49_9ACTN